MVIAHPPCTYLTVSGNRWFDENRYHSNALSRYMDRIDGIRFFMEFVFCASNRVAIENPIGIMSSVYRKPDQIIQPYEYGHNTKKATCLWLKGLPSLLPTNVVEPEVECFERKDGRIARFGFGYWCHDENGKGISWSDPRTAKMRSKTFEGIADAMAEQWGSIE